MSYFIKLHILRVLDWPSPRYVAGSTSRMYGDYIVLLFKMYEVY